MKPDLKLIEGSRAQLEMEIVLKIAEPRNIPEQEFQELIAPLKKRSSLSIVGHSCEPPPPFVLECIEDNSERSQK